VLERAIEETALPLHGRKKNLTKANWLDYFCQERLQLPERILAGIVKDLSDAVPRWRELIGRSFLSPAAREAYTHVLNDRLERLGLNL
jgi:serine/threonine-protein kinase HipA